MKEKYLIIDENNTKLKFYLYEAPNKLLININLDKLNIKNGKYKVKYKSNNFLDIYIPSYEKLVEFIYNKFKSNNLIENVKEIRSIGYKFCGEHSDKSSEILSFNDIKNNELYVLKNYNFIGELSKTFSYANQIVIYDDYFHNTISEENNIYQGHDSYGTVHRYINQFMKRLSFREDVSIINCYIDSDTSICAIKDGNSFFLSNNLTPFECLMQGNYNNREMQNIIEFISNIKNTSIYEIRKILNLENGVKGISNENIIIKILNEANKGNEIAKLTLKKYIDFIIQNICDSYIKLNGKVDSIVLTGYVAENFVEIRKMIVTELSSIYKIEIDEEENNKIGNVCKQKSGVLTTNKSDFPILVIQNQEENILFEETYKTTKNNIKVKKLIPNQ